MSSVDGHQRIHPKPASLSSFLFRFFATDKRFLHQAKCIKKVHTRGAGKGGEGKQQSLTRLRRALTRVPSTPQGSSKTAPCVSLSPPSSSLSLNCCKMLRCILNTMTQVAPLASASKKASSSIKLQLQQQQQLEQLHSTHSSDLKHLSLIS